MKHGINEATVTGLPALRRALERRYPGVTVDICEYRVYPDCEGYTIGFRAKNAKVLIRYGLAQRDARHAGELLAIGAPEVRGWGHEVPGDARVCHHCYDDQPPMPGSRTYPPKWVIVEYERILRRSQPVLSHSTTLHEPFLRLIDQAVFRGKGELQPNYDPPPKPSKSPRPKTD